ncbi:MAG: hypothetical protein LIO85_05685 [Rikenellaceae bacterium]|nr:hypothetical protein [Rikenellaceae bacterium]
MSRTEVYRELQRLEITHRYYPDGVPLKATPCRSTALRMERWGMVIRNTGRGRWVLLGRESGPGCGPAVTGGESLSFDLVPTDAMFWYVTVPADGDSLSAPFGKPHLLKMVDPPVPGVWRLLELTLPASGECPATVALELKCPARFLEYILIPRYNPPEVIPVLREERGRIRFAPAEGIRFLGGEAYRIVSTTAVEQPAVPPYKMILYEPRPAGERILYADVPLPRYDQPSSVRPQDTVATYFYY